MKKLLIIVIACATSLQLFGCSKAQVEKAPVILHEDDAQDNSTDRNDSKTEGIQPLSDQSPKTDTSEDAVLYDNDINSDPSDNISQVEDASKSTSSKELTASESAPFKGSVNLEGMEEEVNYKTYQSALDYQMAYDFDRFTVSSENGIDSFMAENPNPEIYPYVYINIGRNEYIEGKKPDIKNLDLYLFDEELGQDLVANTQKDTVKLGSYDAIHWAAIEGNEWNSPVRHYYLINREEYYYWIKTNYFLEASEGFGARISAMLNSFTLNE